DKVKCHHSLVRRWSQAPHEFFIGIGWMELNHSPSFWILVGEIIRQRYCDARFTRSRWASKYDLSTRLFECGDQLFQLSIIPKGFPLQVIPCSVTIDRNGLDFYLVFMWQCRFRF